MSIIPSTYMDISDHLDVIRAGLRTSTELSVDDCEALARELEHTATTARAARDMALARLARKMVNK